MRAEVTSRGHQGREMAPGCVALGLGSDDGDEG